MSLGTNKNFQVPINFERRIIADAFDYEIEGVWMSLVVYYRHPQSALECLVKGCKA